MLGIRNALGIMAGNSLTYKNCSEFKCCVYTVCFLAIIISQAKKLDNRNQVKIKKISMIFIGFIAR